MSKRYFQNIPVVEYRGNLVRNLLLSAKLLKEITQDIQAFYPYTLEDGDTPTSIAFDYYGSVEYVWLVFLSNDMIDPYTDWYKSQTDFEAYLKDKYGSISSSMATIHHYENTTDPDYPTLSQTSYDYLSASDKASFTAITAYDWEVAENEKKRSIQLIDFNYASKIAHELEVKLNG